MSNTATPPVAHNDFLIRGSDYLAARPDFELIGRDEDISQLAGILMRKNANNALITGPGGVGLTALALGLQASKDKEDTPFEIVGKRFYWLDVDNLFSSGDPTKINEGFQRALATLHRSPDAVLVVDDMRDFVEAARNNGCTHLINALMHAVRSPKLQALFEVRDEDLDTVLKCHSDMQELFTLHDVGEPSREDLQKILEKEATRLTAHYGVGIAPEAITAAAALTTKYRVRDMGLSRAQPERSITLLDRAMATYCQEQHATAPGLADLQKRLQLVDAALASGTLTGELAGRTAEESAAIKASLETDIGQIESDWKTFRGKLRKVYKEQGDGEELIRALEDELSTQQQKEADAAKTAAANPAPAPEPASPKKMQFVGFQQRMASAGFESEAIQSIRARMAAAQKAVEDNRTLFKQLTAEHSRNMVLDEKAVLRVFSTISGIPADKLSENEREKLLHLDGKIKERVFGQDYAVERLTDAVITSRIGKKRSEKPPAFLFIGPSGVGKTEISKALAEALYDDERALLEVNMSEYMEKHAVAKLIGAPPGYEGFEAGGGILPKAMRANPRRIILFDEIEKAHPDVFNLFLQILGDGQMNDNMGRRISFADTIIIMTSNLGQQNFLDKSMTASEQFEKTMTEMKDHGLRPEFLNRFNGRENIIPMNTLPPEIIERIVEREIKKINSAYGDEGIALGMSAETRKAFVAAKYDQERGARGLPGYINAHVESKMARMILKHPDSKGVMEITFNKEADALEVNPPQAAAPTTPQPANDTGPRREAPVASPTQAFKHS